MTTHAQRRRRRRRDAGRARRRRRFRHPGHAQPGDLPSPAGAAIKAVTTRHEQGAGYAAEATTGERSPRRGGHHQRSRAHNALPPPRPRTPSRNRCWSSRPGCRPAPRGDAGAAARDSRRNRRDGGADRQQPAGVEPRRSRRGRHRGVRRLHRPASPPGTHRDPDRRPRTVVVGRDPGGHTGSGPAPRSRRRAACRRGAHGCDPAADHRRRRSGRHAGADSPRSPRPSGRRSRPRSTARASSTNRIRSRSARRSACAPCSRPPPTATRCS